MMQGVNHVKPLSQASLPLGFKAQQNLLKTLPSVSFSNSDRVLFSANRDQSVVDVSQVKYPQSQIFYIASKDESLTIPIRKWTINEELPVDPSAPTAPVFLLIHGLSSRSEWMSPLAVELTERIPGATVYGIDLPNVGQHDYGLGQISDATLLETRIRDTIDYLSEESGQPVFAVGTSLGGLLLSHVAADRPENLAGIGLISPAFKSHPDIKKDLVKGVLNMTLSFRRDKVAKSFKARKRYVLDESKMQGKQLSLLQQKIKYDKEFSNDMVRQLTPMSYLKINKLMKEFRKKEARNLKLPTFAVVTLTDDMIDTSVTLNTLQRLPARNKYIKVLQHGYHDLVVDPQLPDIAGGMADWASEIMESRDALSK